MWWWWLGVYGVMVVVGCLCDGGGFYVMVGVYVVMVVGCLCSGGGCLCGGGGGGV